MTRIVITVEDAHEDGVHIAVECDPPLNEDESNKTEAHEAAGIMLAALDEAGKSEPIPSESN